jgi:hypothetical protein
MNDFIYHQGINYYPLVTSHSLAPTLAILPSVPDLTKGILGI